MRNIRCKYVIIYITKIKEKGDIVRLMLWNISYLNPIEPKLELLSKNMTDKTIIVLLEVFPKTNEYIKKYFDNTHDIYYSLDLRVPSRYDGRNRKIGVTILIDKSYNSNNHNVLNRTPFPDRTSFVDISSNGNSHRVMGLHSLTGVGYGRAKSTQFFSFAESIDEYRPDIVMIDANEPWVDHPNFNENVYNDNGDKGKGAETFFNEMINIGLVDPLRHNKKVETSPLALSYLTYTKKEDDKYKKRYDFIYINKDKFEIEDINYLFEEAINAGSDHALVLCDLKEKL